MTGFKDGAGESPLANDDDNAGINNDESSGPQDAGTDIAQSKRDETEETGLPWKYSRSSITDGREKTVQLHLQQSSLDREREAKSDIESRIGETVNKADLREAAYLVGLQHRREVIDQLREWGYDLD